MPEGVEGNADVGEGAEAGGVEVLSLSSEDEDEGHPELGGEGNAKAVKSPERHPEKRPLVEEDGSGEEKSTEVMSFFFFSSAFSSFF